jgi:osmotically-inducible protein OsmY
MRQFKRVIQIGLGVALVASTLSACAPLVVAGAAGSVMVASDRRTAGTQLEDESIELRAKAAIRTNWARGFASMLRPTTARPC